MKTPKGTELPILNLRGKDYLEVKYRLVWFREERPNWSIETEILRMEKDESVCRATIKDENGRVIAQGTKREDSKGFQDHLEKAETGAIGRSLALCGFGTQFCADELDEGERIVDAPLAREHAVTNVTKGPAPTKPEPQKPAAAAGACEHNWLTSKYIDKETGEFPLFCTKCKQKKFKGAA
jgi:hypothetical protein